MRKLWTRDVRKLKRRRNPRLRQQPRRFAFRASLCAVGGIARWLRLYGMLVEKPTRVSARQWTLIAHVPAEMSIERLVRLCNLIDRSTALSLLTHFNVRIFSWLGRDRRKPPAFYKDRRHAVVAIKAPD